MTGSDAQGDVLRRRLGELLGAPPAPLPGAPPEAARTHRWARAAWGFAREHVAAVVVIALAGCVWTGYTLTQARSVPLSGPAPGVSVTAPRAPGPSGAAPSASPTATVVVHVLGAVVRPGVVRLALGARVEDAIAAAGGLAPGARPGELNLAAVVADGSQIVIGSGAAPGGELRGAGGTGGAGQAAGGPVNLNTATEAQLDALPGVGPVTAASIVAWRAKHGRFARVEELQEVDGIGPKTYAQLAPKVSV